MERVKKGEKYWFIASDFFADDFYITYGVDFYEDIQDGRFALGNYFHTKEEAEAMAKKLRAVLKGADVIEMPSAEEINKQGIEFISDLHGRLYNATSEEMCLQLITYNACGKWLKSKIVK